MANVWCFTKWFTSLNCSLTKLKWHNTLSWPRSMSAFETGRSLISIMTASTLVGLFCLSVTETHQLVVLVCWMLEKRILWFSLNAWKFNGSLCHGDSSAGNAGLLDAGKKNPLILFECLKVQWFWPHWILSASCQGPNFPKGFLNLGW